MKTRGVAWGIAVLAGLAGLGGCSPELNWREVRPGESLLVMFPCKPAAQTRKLPLAGSEVDMTMLACEAGGAAYAVAQADVGDPGRVPAALEELDRALKSKLQGTRMAQPLKVPNATPASQAARWRTAGRAPDGSAIEQEAALFARGTRVFQMVALGKVLDREAMETFFGSARFPG